MLVLYYICLVFKVDWKSISLDESFSGKKNHLLLFSRRSSWNAGFIFSCLFLWSPDTNSCNQPSCVYFVLISLCLCIIISRSSCFSENVNNVGGFCVIKKKLLWVSFWVWRGRERGTRYCFLIGQPEQSKASDWLTRWREREAEAKQRQKASY